MLERVGTPVEKSKISLTRLQPGRSAITPVIGSTLDPMSLLTEVVRAWNRTRASGPAFPTTNLDTRNDRISIGASGTTTVQASRSSGTADGAP